MRLWNGYQIRQTIEIGIVEVDDLDLECSVVGPRRFELAID